MTIYPLQASYADLDMIASPDSFFETVKQEYQDYQKSGFFNRTSQESIYIYEVKTPLRSHTGLLTCVDIRDFAEGRILKHENTISEKEQKMMNMLLQRKALIKPVLLTYPPVPDLKAFIANFKGSHKPLFSIQFKANNELHSVWEIPDGNDIQRIRDLFAERIPKAYIADGHHRCSTSLYLEKSFKSKKKHIRFDLLFSAFFDFDELTILDYNRVVDVFAEMSPARFMAALSQRFDITGVEEAIKPAGKFEITMCIGREWYSLKWKQHVLDRYAGEVAILDAQILDEQVFRDIIGIEDVRADLRIDYIEGARGLDGVSQKVLKNPMLVGFCLYPVAMEEVRKIADANKIMPPKSTWFEPRIKNGVVIYEF